MIGRGSRILNDKNTFTVVDLGNNFHRFGAWGYYLDAILSDLDWQRMFKAPDYYLDAILSDEEIESNFQYELTPEVKKKTFSNSKELYFNMKQHYRIYKILLRQVSHQKKYWKNP